MPKICQSSLFLFKNIFTKLFLCTFFLFSIFFSLMQNYLTTFISSQANNGSTILVGTWHKYCLLLPLLGLGFYSKFYWTTYLFFLKYFLVFYKNVANHCLSIVIFNLFYQSFSLHLNNEIINPLSLEFFKQENLQHFSKLLFLK